MFSTFEDYHDTILAASREADAAIRLPEPSLAKQLTLARWQLARVLRSFPLFKHSESVDPTIAAVAPTTWQLARAVNDRCCPAGIKVEITSAAMATSWRTYQAGSADLIGHRNNILKRERMEVSQMSRGVEKVRHGAALEASASSPVSR